MDTETWLRLARNVGALFSTKREAVFYSKTEAALFWQAVRERGVSVSPITSIQFGNAGAYKVAREERRG